MRAAFAVLAVLLTATFARASNFAYGTINQAGSLFLTAPVQNGLRLQADKLADWYKSNQVPVLRQAEGVVTIVVGKTFMFSVDAYEKFRDRGFLPALKSIRLKLDEANHAEDPGHFVAAFLEMGGDVFAVVPETIGGEAANLTYYVSELGVGFGDLISEAFYNFSGYLNSSENQNVRLIALPFRWTGKGVELAAEGFGEAFNLLGEGIDGVGYALGYSLRSLGQIPAGLFQINPTKTLVSSMRLVATALCAPVEIGYVPVRFFVWLATLGHVQLQPMHCASTIYYASPPKKGPEWVDRRSPVKPPDEARRLGAELKIVQ